jgi:hypothetical protein
MYNTLDEIRTSWANQAAAKLRAEKIDPTNLPAVEAALTACVGGRRLYEFWLHVHGPRQLEDTKAASQLSLL